MAVKNDISLQTFVAAKENGFACSGRRGTDFPRPILIFVAAKEIVAANLAAGPFFVPAI